MIITGKSLPRRTFLKGVGAAVALPFLDSMVPAHGRAGKGRQGADPAGVPLRAQRHRHEELEHRDGRRDPGRAPADPQAARGVPQRLHPARQPDAQQRPRAARRRRRSRPVLGLVPDRHPGQEDHGRHQGEHFLRSDHREQDRARDAVRVARARHGRRAPGGRLRLRLFVRLHEQPRVAQRDPAAAADPRSARAVRAAVRHGRRARARNRPSVRRATAAASWTSSPATRRSSRSSLGPTDRRKLEEYLSSIREVERQLEKAEKESVADQSGHRQAVRRAA